jgi:hypothetical protein
MCIIILHYTLRFWLIGELLQAGTLTIVPRQWASITQLKARIIRTNGSKFAIARNSMLRLYQVGDWIWFTRGRWHRSPHHLALKNENLQTACFIKPFFSFFLTLRDDEHHFISIRLRRPTVYCHQCTCRRLSVSCRNIAPFRSRVTTVWSCMFYQTSFQFLSLRDDEHHFISIRLRWPSICYRQYTCRLLSVSSCNKGQFRSQVSTVWSCSVTVYKQSTNCSMFKCATWILKQCLLHCCRAPKLKCWNKTISELPSFLVLFVAIMNQVMTEDNYALTMPLPITLKETEWDV